MNKVIAKEINENESVVLNSYFEGIIPIHRFCYIDSKIAKVYEGSLYDCPHKTMYVIEDGGVVTLTKEFFEGKFTGAWLKL